MHIFGELVKRFWNGNLNVIKILKQFGIRSIEEITKNGELIRILSRD